MITEMAALEDSSSSDSYEYERVGRVPRELLEVHEMITVLNTPQKAQVLNPTKVTHIALQRKLNLVSTLRKQLLR